MSYDANKKYKSRSSARKHRIKIVRLTTENESGNAAQVETVSASIPAEVKPVTESMRVQLQGINVMARHSISIDGRVDVRESDVIEFNGRRFDVATIKRIDENDRDQIIITQERRP